MFLRKSARAVAAAAALTLAAAVPAIAAPEDPETPETLVAALDAADASDGVEGADDGLTPEGGVTDGDGAGGEDATPEDDAIGGDDADDVVELTEGEPTEGEETPEAVADSTDVTVKAPGASDADEEAELTVESLEISPMALPEPGTTKTFTIANITDFHGRIAEAGVELACYVEDNPDAYLTSSGDNIGATPFVSSAQNDLPTVDLLKAVGLQVSALGNHELDKGWSDFLPKLERGGYPHLAANMSGGPSGPVLDYFVDEIDGVRVGFIGAVTEELPSLITPSHLNGIELKSVVSSVNAVAAQLRDDNEANGEADIVVALIHESMAQVAGQLTGVDLAFGGHTHVAFDNGNAVPLLAMQSIQYGEAISQVEVTIDSDGMVSFDGELIGLKPAQGSSLPAYRTNCDGAVSTEARAIIADAKDKAEEIGSQELGFISDDFNRAQGINPGTGAREESRGEESTVGNLVADAQLWAVQQTEQYADTQLSFMNPGGLRTDLKFGVDGLITLGQAAAMQPFANSLFAMTLTGADVIDVLNEQVQPATSSRPYLKLGVSGLSYTYDSETLQVLDVWLDDGTPLDPAGSYRVVANSFLEAGGDNFGSFTNATNVNDTGIIDLDAFVDFMGANAPESAPLDPSGDVYGKQRSYGLGNTARLDEDIWTGKPLSVDVTGLWFTTGELSNVETLEVYLDGELLGTFPVEGDDADLLAKKTNYGRAAVDVTIPDLSALAEGDTVEFEIVAGGDTLLERELTVGPPTIRIANITDFHGRIAEAGVELACYVEDNPDAYLTSSGDNIGATPFVSSAQNDLPTVDLLKAVGLQVSALGNHELDKGWDDFLVKLDRGGYPHLAANMVGAPDGSVVDSYTATIDGVKVGFVGAVTEELPSLITPSHLNGIDLNDVADSVNDVAGELRAEGAQIVVALIHESMKDLVDELEGVDISFGGHTHVAFDNGNAVPLLAMQSIQYGEAISQVDVTVNSDGTLSFDGELLGLKPGQGSTLTAYRNDCVGPVSTEARAIIADAKDKAEEIGSQELGFISDDFNRAQGINPGTGAREESRGEESTVGNLVADAQLWAVQQTEQYADTQLSFMNPGGLRTDLTYNEKTGGLITLGQAAAMQPFANSLFAMTLTGEDIVNVLEEQKQPAASSRPFLNLGISGLSYEYTMVTDVVDGKTVISSFTVDNVWLDDGTPLDPAGSYRVVANSFLEAGGDNFGSFTNATNVNDTGIIDLDAFVDFMGANAPESAPLDPSGDVYGKQRSWAFTEVSPVPTALAEGDVIELDYAGLWFTTGEASNAGNLDVVLGERLIDSFPVTGDDADLLLKMTNYGRAEVRATIPSLDEFAGEDVALQVVAGDQVLSEWTYSIPTIPEGEPEESDLDPDLENVITVPATASPGDVIDVGTPTLDPGVKIGIWMFSDPVYLGTRTVGENNTSRVTIPADAELGDHKIAVYSADGEQVGWAPIELIAATDEPTDGTTTPPTDGATTPPTDGSTTPPGGTTPDTGANVGGPLIAAMLLLGAGAVFLGARRRMSA